MIPTPAKIVTDDLPRGWEIWHHPGREQPWTVWHDKRHDPGWDRYSFNDRHDASSRTVFAFFLTEMGARVYVKREAPKVHPGPAKVRGRRVFVAEEGA